MTENQDSEGLQVWNCWRLSFVDRLGFAVANMLGVVSVCGAYLGAVVIQKPFMHSVLRSLYDMVSDRDSSIFQFQREWVACSEFLDLADALTAHDELEKT